MLDYIKGKLIEDPEKIQELLEFYGFANVHIRNKYISFGRDETSSRQGITIYIEDNDALLVKDWSHNQCKDIFNYIISIKGIGFRDVINKSKSLLNINDYDFSFESQTPAFGGFYNKIKKNKNQKLKTYDDSIVDNYDNHGNKRFLKDGISLEVQRKYNIGFSIENQAITIPIKNEIGEIIGIKCRANFDVGENEQKYWYDVPCSMSQTLYGYSDNYEYLESSDVVYVFESEKSVLQCLSFGIKNAVALGSGSISKKQIQLLLQLNTNKIVLMHDVSFPLSSIKRNIDLIKGYSRMKEVQIGYWDNENKGYEEKISASDLTKEEFEYILENEIEFMER